MKGFQIRLEFMFRPELLGGYVVLRVIIASSSFGYKKSNQTKTEASFFIPISRIKTKFYFFKKIRPRTGF